MGRGKSLTDHEKELIECFHHDGKSLRQISSLVKKSKTTVYNYLKNKGVRLVKKKAGRKKKLTDRDIRRIRRLASNQMTSINQIKSGLELSASNTTIWRGLNQIGLKHSLSSFS